MCDKFFFVELGMVVGFVGGNVCIDYCIVLERVVGICFNCCDYYWFGCIGKNLL